MKTSLIVKMLWLLLAVFFSGCAQKEVVYVPQKCLVEKPIKSESKNCKEIKSDLEFMQCVAENYYTLQGDYEILEKAFEGCK